MLKREANTGFLLGHAPKSSSSVWLWWWSMVALANLKSLMTTDLGNLSWTSLEGYRHPCPVPDLKGNACSFCPLSMMLAVGLSYTAFIMFRHVLSNPTLLRVLIINGSWILSNAFTASIYVIMWFFFHFMCWITFIDSQVLYQPCIPGINPTWSWCMIILIYFCIQFPNILLRILASMFVRDIGL